MQGDTSAADRRIIDRTIWRVMPMVVICMAVGTIDRSNIGFAKLDMARDLGMSEAAFGLGSSLFYIGYLFFEVPSALAAHRYGARAWLARIMATWGLATLLLAFTSSAAMFYGLRFALGAAEAGLYPALLFYVSLWFPRSAQARAMGMLTIGSALGNAFGALIAGPLLDLRGVAGLQGWQWIFLVTGAIPMITVILVLALIRNTPREAQFLEPAERERLAELIEREAVATAHKASVLTALTDLRTLGHGLAYATILSALYGLIYWSPSLTRSFGATGTQTGLLVALPWFIDIALLLTLPRRLTTPRAVLRAMIALCVSGVASAAIAATVDQPVIQYLALLVCIPSVSLVLGLYWTFPIRIFRGAQSAAAISMISMLGNIGGLVALNSMPAAADWGGGVSAALWVPCVCLSAILIGSAVAAARAGTGATPAASA